MIVLEREKEFGIGSDLYHSGIKRTYQKYGGRLRDKIANHFVESAKVSHSKLGSAMGRHLAGSTVQNPTLNRSLLEKGEKSLNTKIISTWVGNSGYMNAEAIKSVPHSAFGAGVQRDILDAANKGKGVVLLNGKEGTEILAHELGHAHNDRQKGLKKLLQKAGTNLGYRKKLNDPESLMKDVSSAKSVGSILKDYVKGKALVLEESRATKNGLKMLKKAGATKEELNTAREHLGKEGSLGTYIHGTGIINKLGVANKIQIPSRRGAGRNNKSVLNKLRGWG